MVKNSMIKVSPTTTTKAKVLETFKIFEADVAVTKEAVVVVRQGWTTYHSSIQEAVEHVEAKMREEAIWRLKNSVSIRHSQGLQGAEEWRVSASTLRELIMEWRYLAPRGRQVPPFPFPLEILRGVVVGAVVDRIGNVTRWIDVVEWWQAGCRLPDEAISLCIDCL